MSFLKGFGKLQVNGGIGAILPIDGDAESTLVFDNLHVRYAFTPKLFPLDKNEIYRRLSRSRTGAQPVPEN